MFQQLAILHSVCDSGLSVMIVSVCLRTASMSALQGSMAQESFAHSSALLHARTQQSARCSWRAVSSSYSGLFAVEHELQVKHDSIH